MKVLMLSVTAGQGHNQTARGMMEALHARGHICQFVDTYEYISPMLGEAVDKGYRGLIAQAPGSFGRAYELVERAEARSPQIVRANQRVSDRLGERLLDIYESFHPDIVISTHPGAAQISSSVYQMGACSAPRIAVLTDFVLHPLWRGVDVTRLVTPSEQLNYSITRAGIPEQCIAPIGIPIHPKFSLSIEKAQARAEIGIPDIPTVLIMGGSMGHGDMTDAIERLDALPIDFQMVVVCGSNEKLLNRLKALDTVKRLTVLGYVNNVDVLMSAAEMIVTKPGGLSSSEAIAKRLPMVLIDPIPGQEERNMDFLTNHGLAMRTDKRLTVDEVVWQLLSNPQRRSMMREAMEVFGKPNATQDLIRLAEELGGQ